MILAGPRRLTLASLGALALVAASAIFAMHRGSGHMPGYEKALIGAGAAVGAAMALAVRPAWPLSIGLGLAAFSSHWGDMGIPLPGDRILLVCGIVSVLARERIGRPRGLVTRPVDWVLFVVAAYAVGSALWVGALSDHDSRFALTDRFSLIGFALFFVARRAFRDPADRRVLLGTLVVLGAYLGITAILETTGPKGLIFPRYINNPAIGIHFGRARGPFTEASANGLVLYMCAVGSAIAARSWTDRRMRHLAWGLTALCLLGVLLSVTRAPWVGAIAATVIAMLPLRRTRRWVLPAAAAAALGVLLAFAVVPHLQQRAEGRANDQGPVWDRKNSDAAALRMVEARPLLGFGWGRFAFDSTEYFRESQDYPLTVIPQVHNVYLDNAVSLGLLGAGLWLAACAIVLVGGLTRRGPPELGPWKLGLLAVAVAYAINAALTPLTFALPTLLLWTWAGIAWGPEPLATQARGVRSQAPEPRPVPIRAY